MTDTNLPSTDLSKTMPSEARLPKTMNAMLLTGHGGLDKLHYQQDWPLPTIAADEVLIKVAACGLNNTDINTRTAWYSKAVTQAVNEGSAAGFDEADSESGSWGSQAITFPRIQGADAVGIIAAVGDSVEHSRIGERVIIDPWLLASDDWMDTNRSRYFGSECDGGFAQYTKVPSSNAIAISSSLSDAELATFPCAVSTAENLVARSNLHASETVVISGASGGVGSMAVQLCCLRGAKVIAIASPTKAKMLTDLGAQVVIDRNCDNLEAAIIEAANGRVDVALDVVGDKSFMPLINSLKQGGRYSSSGAIAGSMVQFDLRQLIYKDLQLTGATIVPPGTMPRLVTLIEQGKLRPILAATYPLQQLAEAQIHFMKKQHVGNIVVTID